LELSGRGFEGGVGEGFEIEVGEEVVHDGIADQDDVIEGGGQVAVGEEEFGDHDTELVADEAGERGGLRVLEGEVDATHDIGAVACLGVEGSSDGEDVAGGEVEELSDDGGGAEIDGDAEAGLRREREGGVVGQDGMFPLCEFELEMGFGMGAAGEAPAFFEFTWGESEEIVFGGCEEAAEDADATAFAASMGSAREFESVGEEEVVKG
jgi:hypothetical protein